MLISPKTAIKEGWLSWDENVISDIEKYIQPNAIDFDCARIFELDSNTPAFLSEQRKVIRKGNELAVSSSEEYGDHWVLKQGGCYDFVSNFHCKLPAGVAVMLIIRSTLNRSGVFLTSGLYDSGYEGAVAGMLRIGSGDFCLAPNTRIGQVKFIRSEDSGVLYAGGYNHSKGTHWTENKEPVPVAAPTTGQGVFSGREVGQYHVDPTQSPYL